MPLTATPSDCINNGKDVTLYYSVGNCATPIWVEHKGMVGDLNLTDTDDEESLQRRRSSSDIKEYLPGQTEVAFTGQQITDGNYEGNQVINSCNKKGVPKDFLILTSPISTVNAYGYRGKMYNFDRSISGPAEGEQEQQVNLKPAACSDCPVRAVRVTVANAVADYDIGAYTAVSSGAG